jgi:hypothetical protein
MLEMPKMRTATTVLWTLQIRRVLSLQVTAFTPRLWLQELNVPMKTLVARSPLQEARRLVEPDVLALTLTAAPVL